MTLENETRNPLGARGRPYDQNNTFLEQRLSVIKPPTKRKPWEPEMNFIYFLVTKKLS